MNASSPYGGDKGGGRKSSRKAGGQPGNVNRRASGILPKKNATDEERSAFLRQLKETEGMTAAAQAEALRHYVFARVTSLVEFVGVQRVIQALHAIDKVQHTEAKLSGLSAAKQRESVLHGALADVWTAVHECELCAPGVDGIFKGVFLNLKQIGGVSDGQIGYLDTESVGDNGAGED